MTRILIIDDHQIFVEGCRSILEKAGITDVRIEPDLERGLQSYRGARPNVVFIDLAVEGGAVAVLNFIRRLRHLHEYTRFVILTTVNDADFASRALKAGADGYLLKEASSEDLLESLRAVLAGRVYLSHGIAMAISAAKLFPNPLSRLSDRELLTLSRIADGKSYHEIAEELQVSYKTVANYCTQIKAKFNAKSMADLMRKMMVHLPQSGIMSSSASQS